jgi:hypothetical protein
MAPEGQVGEKEMKCISKFEKYYHMNQCYSGERCGPWASCFSSSDRINSKLDVKVARGLGLSWLVSGADRPRPSWLAPQCFIPRSNFWNDGTISCNTVTSYESLNECFPYQLNCWRYVFIWQRNDKKTYFYQKFSLFSFPSKDHHRWHMLILGA